MSKYIDLLGEIGIDKQLGTVGATGSLWTLRWLDEHPDQAPGRTMTESELYAAANVAGDSGEFDVEEFARQVGIIIVPDPEPTNAEKLNALICKAAGSDASLLAAALDEAGVKAPGGES